MSGPLGFGDDERGRPPGHEPAPDPEREDAPRPPISTGRYTWFVGGIAVVVLILIGLSAVGGAGSKPGGPVRGERLLPFAVPLAGAPPRADGNEDAQLDPSKACGLRGAGVLNLCTERDAGPVVLALFPTKAARCRAVLDQFDRLAPRLPQVRFVAVGSEGRRGRLGSGHRFPVGWDRDGAVAQTYGLVGCPQITFARRGGAVVETTRKELGDATLAAKARALLR